MRIQEEFIGHELQVLESKNSSLKGIKGKVLDETKETFTIRADKEMKILKQGNKFQIADLTVQGDQINKRPEERLKLK